MKNKNAAVIEQAEKFFETLPNDICGFKLKKIFVEEEDRFIYFNFENQKKHRALTAYFHEETSEFKLRVKVGLSEYCLTEFFTSNFEDFSKKIETHLEATIKNFSATENINPIVREKNFSEWNYGKNLPANIEGFELFISPQNPVPFTNGSHIIINYSDFAISGDLTIYYNIYGDNFSGETKIKNIPQIVYNFDSTDLKELENKLEKNLVAELLRIRNFY